MRAVRPELATVGIDGMEAGKIASFLWDKYRIVVAGISQGGLPGPQFPYQGVRVTPNVSTTIGEIDTFIDAMQALLKL